MEAETQMNQAASWSGSFLGAAQFTNLVFFQSELISAILCPYPNH
jgi:hypothetical protein